MADIYSGVETAADLISITSGLRRALRRLTGRTGGVSELSEAQRELVRLVRRRPGARVGEVAAALNLAPNTVSTLVTGLCASGWLQRGTDPGDGRSALLDLTPAARARVAQWRDRRQSVLSDALARLSLDDQAVIQRALPALQRLLRCLQESE